MRVHGRRPAGVVRLKIAAVIFDMDGVLLDSEPVHEEVAQALLAECGVAAVSGATYVGMTTRDSFTRICRELALPHDPAELDARYTARVIPLLRRHAVPLPGVPDVPLALKARGLPLAVGSSSRLDVIEATLAGLGVRSIFDAVVSAADLPRGKPAPDVFLEAARRLGVAPEACVVIEDSEHGVQAARAAGMRCVAIPCGVTRGHDFAGATLVLGGLPELLDCHLFTAP
jgi:HAD superfamily hydrolase (TIGR01509 family)